MHLHDWMGWPGPVTDDQKKVWLEWFRLKDERPDLTDWCILRVAQMHAKEGTTLEDLRPKFTTQAAGPKAGDKDDWRRIDLPPETWSRWENNLARAKMDVASGLVGKRRRDMEQGGFDPVAEMAGAGTATPPAQPRPFVTPDGPKRGRSR